MLATTVCRFFGKAELSVLSHFMIPADDLYGLGRTYTLFAFPFWSPILAPCGRSCGRGACVHNLQAPCNPFEPRRIAHRHGDVECETAPSDLPTGPWYSGTTYLHYC